MLWLKIKHKIYKLHTWRIFRQISQILSTFCGRSGTLSPCPKQRYCLWLVLRFTILKPRKEVLVSLGLLYWRHRKRSLYLWVYYTDATERRPCIFGFTVLTPRKEVLVSLGLLYWRHGKRSLYLWVYYIDTTERCPCIFGFTILTPRKEVLVSLGLLYWSHGKMSLYLWVYYTDATERCPCNFGFTILKPRKEVLVSLDILYWSHGKRSLYLWVYYTEATERGLVYTSLNIFDFKNISSVISWIVGCRIFLWTAKILWTLFLYGRFIETL
jgi:hypothetical protein